MIEGASQSVTRAHHRRRLPIRVLSATLNPEVATAPNNSSWRLLTPPTPGAVAIIEIVSRTPEALSQTLVRLNIAPVDVGRIRLRSLGGIDRGLVARWTPLSCHLMPHGGVAVIRAILDALANAGIPERGGPPLFPEASSPIESRMLAALARAASPLAIDLLLDQPRRWSTGGTSDPKLDIARNRLLDPPLIVALGPPNIGKSTLVNTLAGRTVSIVADEAGTTRDHVGVLLDLAGLVVRYADTPGMVPVLQESEDRSLDQPENPDAAARFAALELTQRADAILLLGDASSPPLGFDHIAPASPRLSVALRHDLGRSTWKHDLSISCHRNQGLSELVMAVRELLVPRAALVDPRPWRFWTEGLE